MQAGQNVVPLANHAGGGAGMERLARLAQSSFEITRLSADYAGLKQLLTDDAEPLPGADPATRWSQELAREKRRNAISDAMDLLAWKILGVQAYDWRDARAKAIVLLDWVGHDPTDLADQLTASLSRDIIMLTHALDAR